MGTPQPASDPASGPLVVSLRYRVGIRRPTRRHVTFIGHIPDRAENDKQMVGIQDGLEVCCV